MRIINKTTNFTTVDVINAVNTVSIKECISDTVNIEKIAIAESNGTRVGLIGSKDGRMLSTISSTCIDTLEAIMDCFEELAPVKVRISSAESKQGRTYLYLQVV